MLAAGMSYREAAQALVGVGKVSSARKPLSLAQVGKTLRGSAWGEAPEQ